MQNRVDILAGVVGSAIIFNETNNRSLNTPQYQFNDKSRTMDKPVQSINSHNINGYNLNTCKYDYYTSA